MKLEVDIVQQNILFLQAIVLGAFIGLFYDIFRMFRIAFKCNKVIVCIQDIVFWIIISVASFLFMLIFNAGIIRGYLLMAELIGAILYHLTIGMLLMKISNFIIDKIKKILRFFYNHFIKPIGTKIIMPLFKFIKRKFIEKRKKLSIKKEKTPQKNKKQKKLKENKKTS